MWNIYQNRLRLRLALSAVTLSGFVLAGCLPPFAEFQSARLVGRGAVDVTPFYSSVWSSADGETERIQNHVGVATAVGVSDAFDLRLRYEYVSAVENGDGGVHILGFGPKIRLVTDRLAFSVPVGTAFGRDVESSESWQIHPTLLLTLPASDKVDITASAKLLHPFNEDLDDLISLNLGIGIGGSGPFVLRPEAGYIFNPGQDGYGFHIGIGLSVRR